MNDNSKYYLVDVKWNIFNIFKRSFVHGHDIKQAPNPSKKGDFDQSGHLLWSDVMCSTLNLNSRRIAVTISVILTVISKDTVDIF